MFFRDKRILVTGAAGLVGSNLLRALHTRGARLRATFLHRRPPLLDNVDYCMGADLTLTGSLRRSCARHRLCFLCAASTSGAAAINATPLIHVTPNILMNSQMLEAAYLAGVQKVLYLSSTGGYPVMGRPYREEDMFSGDLGQVLSCGLDEMLYRSSLSHVQRKVAETNDLPCAAAHKYLRSR